MAVLLLKFRVSEEVADEDGVVTLHDYRHGDSYRPTNSTLVGLNSLPETLRVFFVGGMFGIDQSTVAQCLFDVMAGYLLKGVLRGVRHVDN
jgi:hypothetical protein